MPDSFYEQTSSRFSYVDHYWHMRDSKDGTYQQYATVKWGFVFSEYNGVYRAQLLGPRVSPAAAPFRKGEYFWGIVLHGEVSLADHSKKALLNKSIELPLSSDNTLILNGHKLPLPAYEALEDFTETLIKANLLPRALSPPFPTATNSANSKRTSALRPSRSNKQRASMPPLRHSLGRSPSPKLPAAPALPIMPI